jgi:hypothetical protein
MGLGLLPWLLLVSHMSLSAHDYPPQGQNSFILLYSLGSYSYYAIVNITIVVFFFVVVPCIGGCLWWLGFPCGACFAACCGNNQTQEVVYVQRVPEVRNNVVVVANATSYPPPNQPVMYAGPPGNQAYSYAETYQYSTTPMYYQYQR